MFTNMPSDGYDTFGQLGLTLDDDDSLLDSFLAEGYIHGWSFGRKLISTATNAYQARRETDDATQSIGFSGTLVDTAALSSFASATDTRVQIWYDQVNSDGDATATLNAPSQYRLINGGTIEEVNSELACCTSVASGNLTYVLSVADSLSAFTLFVAMQNNTGNTGTQGFINSSDGTDTTSITVNTNNYVCKINNNFANVITSPSIVSDEAMTLCITRSGADVNFWRNNVDEGSATTALDTFQLEALFRSGGIGFKIAEIHVFDNVVSESTRNAFNLNLNTAIGI